MKRHQRKLGLAATALVLLGLALFGIFRDRQGAKFEPPLAREAAVLAPATPRLPRFINTDRPVSEEGKTTPPPDPGRFKPDPALAEEGPGPHFEKYGFRSGRLARGLLPEGADPITRVNSLEGKPSLTVWAANARVSQGETATIIATLTGPDGSRISPDAIDIDVSSLSDRPFEHRTSMKSGPDGTWIHEFKVTGAPSDKGKLMPPTELNVRVTARGTLDGKSFERGAATMLFVQDPGAHWREDTVSLQREGSDLTLEVQADVERAGTYWLYAELWGGPGGRTPVAFAMDRLEGVSPGPLSHRFLFGGGVIHDSKVDGPYVVRNVRLNQVDTLPPHESEPIAQLSPSPPWHADEFQ